jgi:hypothetical protein
VGVGAGNYDRDYFILRRTTDDVRQPHSIEMQTLAELGLLGGLALAAFFVAVGVGVVRRVRAGPSDAVVLVGTLGVFSSWVAHTSVDWPHLLPGATGIALSAAAYLATEPAALAAAGQPRRPVALGWVVRGLAVVAVVVGAVFVARATVAAHYLDSARDALDTHPIQAIHKANDSLAFNADSLDALYLKSAAYARLGDYEHSRAALREATRLEPHNFVAWALLGDLEVRRGHVERARALYAHASRLNPRDGVLRDLVKDPLAGFAQNG